MFKPSANESIVFSDEEREVVHYLTHPLGCLHHLQNEHLVAYVYSGALSITDGKQELFVSGGHGVFIRKNHRIRLSLSKGDDQEIKIAFLILGRKELVDFHLNSKITPTGKEIFKPGFLKISSELSVESLFLSLIPFIDAGISPSPDLLKSKIREAMDALLGLQQPVMTALFDFIDPWKIDLLDFMNNNFMYDLSLKELAWYTGRSVATFKRDFSKISTLPPQRWIIRKRLESAHQHLEEGKKVSDFYLDLGFLSLSHFSTAYKKEYGIAPTKK